MKRLRSLKLAIVCILSATAHAGAAVYEGNGEGFDLSCTKHGYSLTASNGQGILYLGRSCDAFSKAHGKGSWCWANGGFAAQFKDYRFGFPRQELSCPKPTGYEQNCRC
jgi:hypothetical protein